MKEESVSRHDFDVSVPDEETHQRLLPDGRKGCFNGSVSRENYVVGELYGHGSAGRQRLDGAHEFQQC